MMCDWREEKDEKLEKEVFMKAQKRLNNFLQLTEIVGIEKR